jgi:hypothetical protein
MAKAAIRVPGTWGDFLTHEQACQRTPGRHAKLAENTLDVLSNRVRR